MGGGEDAPHLGYDARAVTVLEEAMALGVVPQVRLLCEPTAYNGGYLASVLGTNLTFALQTLACNVLTRPRSISINFKPSEVSVSMAGCKVRHAGLLRRRSLRVRR